MHKNDAIRLQHMLDAAREALSFAAGKVSLECRSECPAISWADIIAMRNRLIHAYFDINLDIVWQTVKEELPPLIIVLEKVLSSRDTE